MLTRDGNSKSAHRAYVRRRASEVARRVVVALTFESNGRRSLQTEVIVTGGAARWGSETLPPRGEDVTFGLMLRHLTRRAINNEARVTGSKHLDQ